MYFLNINKPKGISSFDVIRFLRKKLKIKQIGHSGTLDPLATGVMQIAVGKATKLLDYLDSDKCYSAEIKFGYNTETYDSEGEEIFIKQPDFSESELKECLNGFLGKTKQIPPKYSAIKIDGKKLCDIARKSPQETIAISEREIEIYSIELVEFNKKEYKAKINVTCKKGTYIRSLAFDIGKKLGCGAYLTELKRTKAGNFLIENSNNLDDEKYKEINPMEALNNDKYELNNEEFNRIRNGNFIKNLNNFNNKLLLLTKDNKLIAIATVENNLIKPKKYFGE